MDDAGIPIEVLERLLNEGDNLREGTVWFPLNEAGAMEHKRHIVAVDDILKKMKTAALALKLLRTAMEKEHEQWRDAMVRAHPEWSDYNFRISDDGTKVIMFYRMGQAPFPGDTLATPEGTESPAWVKDMMNDPNFKKH